MLTRALVLLTAGLVASAWGQEKGWEKEWSQTLAAAKKEGKVVVMGSADPVVRRELPAKFRERFGVDIEYLGGRGADNTRRLRMEHQARTYTVDAVFAGLSNLGGELYVEKLLDPLRPLLILPEVVDPSKWKRGKLWFADPEDSYILRLYSYISAAGVYVNTQHVKPEEFRSVRELLNPKWKGKISVYDPTVSGTGSMDAARYLTEFGEEFVKRLYVDQKPVVSRDKRQLADWLGRGTYPISLGVETEAVINMKKQGLPVAVLAVPDAPATLSAGNGMLGLVTRAPHPNAARLFVNWITSKEGLELLARARNKPQTRADIDESYALPWEIPQPGVNYFDSYEWNFQINVLPKVKDKMNDILKR